MSFKMVVSAQLGNQLLYYKKNPLKKRAFYGKQAETEVTIKGFHEILRPLIFIGNVFSIFPVSGVFSKNAEKLLFRLFYPITIYSLVVQLCFIIELVLLFLFLSKSGLKFFIVGQIIYTSVCVFGGTYFLYLATKWRQCMSMWMEHERIFLVAPYSNKIKGNFVLKIQVLGVIVVVLSLLDHYVYFITAVEKVENAIKNCEEHQRDFWKIFYVNERQVFYTVFPYYSWQIPFLEWYEVVKTMCWTYSEVFVSAVAIVLTKRFQQLTNRLKVCDERHFTDAFWHETRCHYNILCNLVLKADKILSPFILVYSFSNLFFICQKIFIQFEHNKTPSERYYSYYSSVLLICRTIGMLYSLALVNEKPRETLKVMRDVTHRSSNCLDYHRMLDVIQSNTVALSGFRFFFVTKGMILTLAGTILTYELVLVQQIDEITGGDNVTTNACGEVFV